MKIAQSTVRAIKDKLSLFHCGCQLSLGYTMVTTPNPEWITTTGFISHSGYTSAVGGLPLGGFAACISHPENQVFPGCFIYSCLCTIRISVLYIYGGWGGNCPHKNQFYANGGDRTLLSINDFCYRSSPHPCLMERGKALIGKQ